MRTVLIHWKKQNETEIFSNLKYFCLSYPQYNYNTLNNYLSKEKIPYENETIRVERKHVITKPRLPVREVISKRSIVPVLRRVPLKEAQDDIRDWQYWLSQPVAKRAEAVTFLVAQMMRRGQRMNKKVVNKVKMRQ